MNAPEAAAALARILAIYHTAGMRAWIQDGTLLGAVRDGHIIPWDTDTDVGVYSWEWTPAIHQTILKAGFREEAAWNTRERDFHQKYSWNGILIDVFHYYRASDGTIYHGLRGGRTRFHYPTEFEFAPIELNGVELNAPFPPEQFVRTKYGLEWRMPRKRWNCSRDPRNARPA